ncbi:ImmA/IrrE family metallo-endopeptidase [Peribacillus sp. R9-11]|uniref:ImmA/IrrE family metallo-endopeptidase n=1 Tax=Peribacillus sp. R9-11 TaxID=3073271 RepID=UPI00286900DA|nr:ImmA/IrrE family metallo-endopeptidase [Peribacillus sp. R9-11]WMX57435.1 ImmA/IrrE family metallo-endopeptidase [Peribacillus sp. R9-11]
MVNSIPREKKLAQRISKKYSLTPPINIRELIDKYAKCVEDSVPSNADAICIMNIERPVVFLDRFKSETRKRFTLAHELGHLIIPWHNGMISCHTDKVDMVDQTAYQIMESEANSFAAEILMPTEWLTEMVLEKEKSGLKDLMDFVAKKAEVSRSAAFFSVIKHLPSGYVFHIQNNEMYFDSFKRSPGTSIIIPSQDDKYDRKWLDEIAIKTGTYDLDSIQVKWWKVPNVLSTDQLTKIIEESKDLTYIRDKVNRLQDDAFVSSFTDLINLLPTGYIIDIKGGDYNRFFRSPNTNIGIPNFKSANDEIAWFKEHSYKSGYFKYLGYNYFWGYFVVKTPHNQKTQDKRLSKDILKAILRECYSEDSKRKKLTHKMNGIIGSLNNKAPSQFNEFYRLFQERLLGEQIFERIMQHKDFEVFMINKINELLAKRVNR